jgi:hypothetical protein
VKFESELRFGTRTKIESLLRNRILHALLNFGGQ